MSETPANVFERHEADTHKSMWARHIPPLAVLLLGLISVSLLVWSNKIIDSMYLKYYPWDEKIKEMETEITISHLWLEEYVEGHYDLHYKEIDHIFEEIDSTLSGFLNGRAGSKGPDVDRAIEAFTDYNMRLSVNKLKTLMEKFKAVSASYANVAARASNRFPLLDADHDEIFHAILAETEALAELVDKDIDRSRYDSKIFFRLMLAVWALIVSIATIGLWFWDGRRKKAERVIKESEKKYRALFEGASDAILTAALRKDNPIISACNSRALDIFGCEPDDIIGKSLFCLNPEFQPDGVDSRRKLMRLLEISRAGCSQFYEWTYQKSDGELFDSESTLGRMDIGSEKYAQIIVRDVTERKRAEQKLQSLHEQLKISVEHMPIAYIMWTRDLRVLEWNKAAEKIFGLSKEETLGKRALELIGEKDFQKQAEEALLLEPSSFLDSANNLRKDRTAIRCRWHNTQLKDRNGCLIGMLSMVEDFTERAEMEDQLRHAQKMDAIGQLAGGIAHDFNNQLAGIIGYAEVLAEHATDEKFKKYAEAILKAGERSADLTAQLLAFARKGHYLCVAVDVHQVIGEVITLLEHSIDKRIRLEAVLNSSKPIVDGDPTQIQNALLNIALNARDAMPEGGTLKFSTELVQLDEAFCLGRPYQILPGEFLEICIKDNGKGMDQETRLRIFEPFFTTKQKGTGMGLAAAYGTIKNHKGVIHVESELGKGSVFKIYLPVAKQQKRVVIDNHGDKRDPCRFARILVVDDEEMVREMAGEILENAGHQAVLCSDGEEALEYYRKSWRDIDLVILDMIMPKKTGREVFAEMKAMNPDLKVVISSGYSINNDAKAVLDNGAIGFLQKPFRLCQLTSMVENICTASK